MIYFFASQIVTGFWFVVSSGRTIPAQAIISNVVNSERRGSFMSINSSVQQISVGLASVIAGLVVIKTPTNALAHYEITGYISIAVTLVSIFVISKLNARMNVKGVEGGKGAA